MVHTNFDKKWKLRRSGDKYYRYVSSNGTVSKAPSTLNSNR